MHKRYVKEIDPKTGKPNIFRIEKNGRRVISKRFGIATKKQISLQCDENNPWPYDSLKGLGKKNSAFQQMIRKSY